MFLLNSGLTQEQDIPTICVPTRLDGPLKEFTQDSTGSSQEVAGKSAIFTVQTKDFPYESVEHPFGEFLLSFYETV